MVWEYQQKGNKEEKRQRTIPNCNRLIDQHTGGEERKQWIDAGM